MTRAIAPKLASKDKRLPEEAVNNTLSFSSSWLVPGKQQSSVEAQTRHHKPESIFRTDNDPKSETFQDRNNSLKRLSKNII